MPRPTSPADSSNSWPMRSTPERAPVPAAPAAATAARPMPPSLAELKALVTRARLPEEGLDEFLEILKQAVDDVGVAHPELLRLTLPFREYITGDDGLAALRRNLERIQARRDETANRDASGTDRS